MNILKRLLAGAGCALLLFTAVVLSARKARVAYVAQETAAAPARTVYLTFDDGPSANTEKILDVLDEYGVKATFFVTGQFPDYFPALTRAAESGHLIAPHSYTHEFSKIYSGVDAFFDDQQQILDVIFTYTATTPSLLRFPSGSSNTVGGRSIMKKLVAQCAKRGIAYCDWNVDSRDWQNNRSAASITDNVLTGVERTLDDSIVILMHDAPFAPHTPEALASIIEELQNQGFAFDTVDHIPAECHHKI